MVRLSPTLRSYSPSHLSGGISARFRSSQTQWEHKGTTAMPAPAFTNVTIVSADGVWLMLLGIKPSSLQRLRMEANSGGDSMRSNMMSGSVAMSGSLAIDERASLPSSVILVSGRTARAVLERSVGLTNEIAPAQRNLA